MKSFLKKEQKVFYVKALNDLTQVETAIDMIRRNVDTEIELSILGKLSHDEFNNKKILVKKRRALRTYWHEHMDKKTDIGFFFHPEIGQIYIIGPLVPMFLYDVSGKKLGALTGGTYGILRGFGIGPKETMDFLNILDKGSYLLILKGYKKPLSRVENLLNKLNL
tara:strand:- start:333 stop:827 length:495 start_codon:yes stop_codon:yes gene_type:complete